MRLGTRIAIATVAAGLVIGIAVLTRSGSGEDAVRDLGLRLDLVEDGPLLLWLVAGCGVGAPSATRTARLIWPRSLAARRSPSRSPDGTAGAPPRCVC